MFTIICKPILVVLLASMYIAIQSISFVHAEANSVNVVKSIDIVQPVKTYANDKNIRTNENDYGVDGRSISENTYYIKQNSKHKYSKDNNKNTINKIVKVKIDKPRWHFDKKIPENQNKWKNSTKPEQLLGNAATNSYTKVPPKVKEDNQLDLIHMNNLVNPLEPSRNIEISDNLRIVSKKNVNVGFFNNAKNIHLDQQVYMNKTATYGAYAEVYSEDDFRFSVGPEYSHTDEISVSSGTSKSSSNLGLGLQLMFGF